MTHSVHLGPAQCNFVNLGLEYSTYLGWFRLLITHLSSKTASRCGGHGGHGEVEFLRDLIGSIFRSQSWGRRGGREVPREGS